MKFHKKANSFTYAQFTKIVLTVIACIFMIYFVFDLYSLYGGEADQNIAALDVMVGEIKTGVQYASDNNLDEYFVVFPIALANGYGIDILYDRDDKYKYSIMRIYNPESNILEETKIKRVFVEFVTGDKANSAIDFHTNSPFLRNHGLLIKKRKTGSYTAEIGVCSDVWCKNGIPKTTFLQGKQRQNTIDEFLAELVSGQKVETLLSKSTSYLKYKAQIDKLAAEYDICIYYSYPEEKRVVGNYCPDYGFWESPYIPDPKTGLTYGAQPFALIDDISDAMRVGGVSEYVIDIDGKDFTIYDVIWGRYSTEQKQQVNAKLGSKRICVYKTSSTGVVVFGLDCPEYQKIPKIKLHTPRLNPKYAADAYGEKQTYEVYFN